MKINFTDQEISLLLEALNESYHLAIKELKNSPNTLHEAVFTSKRDLSLELIKKLENI